MQQEHRHEDNADAQRGQHGWNTDLPGTRHDRLVHAIALVQAAFDVLDHHGAVVHQNTDRERESTQREGIQGLPGQVQDQQGANHGQRNRRQDDQGQSPVAQEQQDHQSRQARRHLAAHDHAVERRPHKDRLVKDGLHAHPRRQAFGDVRQQGAHAVDHRQGRYAAGLADHHQGARFAVHIDGIGLHLIPVVHMRDIAHEHRPPIHVADRKAVHGG